MGKSEFKMPSLGAEMVEGRLVEWKVKPGDRIKRGDSIAVVDTDKAAIDVQIWEDGIIESLVVKPGETVPVGTVLALLQGEGAETPAAKPSPSAPSPKSAPQERQPISPAARKRAAELGVDPTKISGSGPGGAVTLADIEKATPKEKEGDGPRDRTIEMRNAIGVLMARSKKEIPHYYLSDEIPMLRATEWLQKENAARPITERILMPALLFKATALAAKAFPDMNGYFKEGKFEPAASVHLGVAISLRQGGLIAPAIHHVQSTSLGELMVALMGLVQRARTGGLRSSEMMDGTLTVTNLGDQGVGTVFGVIYPPQVALVGFGKISDRPWVEGTVVKSIPVVSVTLSADHRVSDGHRGALFLTRIKSLLQEPEKL